MRAEAEKALAEMHLYELRARAEALTEEIEALRRLPAVPTREEATDHNERIAREARRLNDLRAASHNAQLQLEMAQMRVIEYRLEETRSKTAGETWRHLAVAPIRLATPPEVQTVVDTATRKLGSIPAWVPRRICEEEIGDALEQIHRFDRERAPGWEKRIRAKVLSARFWVLMHAVREIVASALGRKGA